MNSYDDLKDEKHIFIYAVCGRSSSTALQRILNSSNEVCIWGEPWGMEQLFLKFRNDFNEVSKTLQKKSKEHLAVFTTSFKTGVHDKFYPNAIRDIGHVVDLIDSAFVEIFKPIEGIRRMGFKEIKISDPITLETLIGLFPNCKILFLFRDPLKQWVSIRDSKAFPLSNDVNKFVDAYKSRAEIYMKVALKFASNCCFVENTQLYHINEVRRLVNLVGLQKCDESLINKTVSSLASNPLTDFEAQVIRKEAMDVYETLRKLRF